jgi:2-dehydro-3-deoxyphosphogluconate aldolase/(4S)-4-hydroxy-2-oxoglutarate aldolase
MPNVDLTAILERDAVVPIFSRADAAEAERVAAAVAAAGGRVLEFTNRQEDALSTFAHLAAFLRDRQPQVALGAGTVFDAATAVEFIDRGAAFVVSPAFDDAVLEVCGERGVPYVPGCFTATEVRRAHAAGCTLIKLFPAGPVGTGYLRALGSVFPAVRFVPTGGITADPKTVAKWLAAGAIAVGLGSDLIAPAGASPWKLDRVPEVLRPLLSLRAEGGSGGR